MADGQTINIPQLLVVILLGGLAIRYFFFAPATSQAAAVASRGNNNLRAREADVERIQQMFPQLSRRHIIWDLQRNGGNVVATTERILSGRGLENPPISFQPPAPEPSSSNTPPVQSISNKPVQPDLIKRYNLQSKIEAEEAEKAANQAEAAKASGKQGWSQNKDERQALLRRRREEMILAARRKMAAKIAEGDAPPNSS